MLNKMRLPAWSRLDGFVSRIGAACLCAWPIAAPSLSAQTVTVSPAQYSALPVPEEQVDRAIVRLDALAEDMLERSGIPGLAVAVVWNGETVYSRGFGLRRVDADVAVDADTVFLLASLSKPLGATVIASQVSAGRVEWNTPIASLLPWFALSDEWVTRQLTIGDLYAHRSGLPDHAGDLLEDIGFDQRTILERLALLDLHPFRSHYAYTNFGLTAAAEGVAQAAGMDWATLSNDALYAPLGMAMTSSLHADFMARENRASSHIPSDGGYVVADLRQPDAQSPAGGASSSVTDMARWMAFILQGGRLNGEEFISYDALLPALSPQIVSAPSGMMDARAGMYGYGFNVGVQPSGRVAFSHSGAFALGAGTSVSMIPSLDIGIVVLTNAAPVGAAEAISATFLDEVQFGQSTRDWFAGFSPMMAQIMAPDGELVGVARPEDPDPSRPLASYTASYENAYFGALEVVVRDGALAMLLGPDREVEMLDHWDGDRFTYAPFSENSFYGSISQVTFGDFDVDHAGTVHIEALDNLGFGTFRH
ncbi:serine hydrolase [Gymnodinialimonas sp. 57CJ19]|uniref:serine hydrolase n=1 Tax=Gymnodinialimonas sp. 57CJ19 TaxID=3138498 RepID=UPI0031343FE6